MPHTAQRPATPAPTTPTHAAAPAPTRSATAAGSPAAQLPASRFASTAAPPTVTYTASLGAFRDAVSSSFVPLEATAASRRAFAATLSAAGTDGVVFTEVRATPHQIERTHQTIASGGSGYYKVSLMLAGTGLLVQDGREVVMRPGELSFYDTSRPYSLVFDEEFRNLIMMFPKDRVEFPTTLVDSLTAVSLTGELPLASAVSQFISQASPQFGTLPLAAQTKLTHTSVQLINTIFSAVLGLSAESAHPRQAMMQQITAYINSNLGMPGLSPRSIAEANFISTRHLHALFAEMDTTVSAWIRERRLDRCRRDLVDPAQTHRGVASIAAGWGFSDAAHFSRVFRAAYGLSPTELRRQHSAWG